MTNPENLGPQFDAIIGENFSDVDELQMELNAKMTKKPIYDDLAGDLSLNHVTFSTGICKTCNGRTQMIGSKDNIEIGPHIHARYPMGHPADPRPRTEADDKSDARAMKKLRKKGKRGFKEL